MPTPLQQHQVTVAEAEEREKLMTYLIEDWDSSFAQDPDCTFEAIAAVLRDGHVGYKNAPLDDLRRWAADAGYESED